MIIFNPEHLPKVKEQAYAVRDLLADIHTFESLLGKAAWLSIYAKSLGYADWGNLQSLVRSHRTSNNDLVLTPEHTPTMARKIQLAVGNPRIDRRTIEATLESVVTENEAIRFGGRREILMPPPEFILEFGPEHEYAKPLLHFLVLSTFDGISRKKVVEGYCESMKQKRRGLSKQEVKERSLDVYAKSGVRVEAILAELIDGGYVTGDESLEVTERGKDFVLSELTDDFGEKWQTWFKELLQLLEAVPYLQVREDWTLYVRAFANGVDAHKAASLFSWGSVYTDSDHAVRNAISESLGETLPEYPQQRYFFFLPRIFLDPELVSIPTSDVQFTVECPEWAMPKGGIRTERFWPNRRYVSVGSDHRGWFAKIPDDVNEFEVTYHWRSAGNRFRPVEHKVTYKLLVNEDMPQNWLYSIDAMSHDQSTMAPMNFYETSFHSLRGLTSEPVHSEADLIKLDRVKAGIEQLVLGDSVKIKERRTVLASNSYFCLGARHL